MDFIGNLNYYFVVIAAIVAISGGKMYSVSDESVIQTRLFNTLFILLFVGFLSQNLFQFFIFTLVFILQILL
ncbi:hypothetical protein [Deferribacter desulfuricans]|uniref:hypothetical protein n=1 Tax=Deferribacter desulfuricans TaxID=197162 RepID=UPI00031EEA56|nr:hypothetical protein [Deferribacter desulfuricans]